MRNIFRPSAAVVTHAVNIHLTQASKEEAASLRSLRPATADEYASYLLNRIKADGQISHIYDYPFSRAEILVATRSVTVPKAAGSGALNILVPEGVEVKRTGSAFDHGHDYHMLSGSVLPASRPWVPIYPDVEKIMKKSGWQPRQEHFTRIAWEERQEPKSLEEWKLSKEGRDYQRSKNDAGWEILHHKGAAECTEIMPFNGGWLVRTKTWDKQDGTNLAVTFVAENPSANKAINAEGPAAECPSKEKAQTVAQLRKAGAYVV